MELGDRVVFYAHEMSDLASRTIDQLAFVVGIVDDHTLDVVIFPPGGPITFARVGDFGDLTKPVGSSYWRAKGSEPPDFKQYEEYQALLVHQRDELSKVAPADKEALLLTQESERQAFLGKSGPESEPLPPLSEPPPATLPRPIRGATE